MNNTKKRQHIKKIETVNENSSPEARGSRLRKIRNLANLSREELASACNITSHSLKRWELGYLGGLPLDGAKNILEKTAKKGVVCSLEWLLHEIGSGPSIIPDFEKHNKDFSEEIIIPTQTEDDDCIIRELNLFRRYYKNTIEHQITDDGLSPAFNPGDYVAGAKVSKNKFASLIGKNCIVLIENGSPIVRNLRQGTEKGKYSLICTNTNTTVTQPVLHNIKISELSPILRHYIKNK